MSACKVMQKAIVDETNLPIVDSAIAAADAPPTVEECLDRLAGRRAQSIELQAHVRTVVETRGQNRKTRRNNLRVGRLAASR